MDNVSSFRSWITLLILGCAGAVLGAEAPAMARSTCPQAFEPFITELLAELPAYANRVNTRANNRKTYLLLAGRADFEALPMLQASFPTSEQPDSQVRQVFFSTLLKRSSQQRIVYQQEHHWLLMAPSDRGWEFVQMSSILDSYPSQTLAALPRNSSEGSIATAIKDWLQTCHYSATS